MVAHVIVPMRDGVGLSTQISGEVRIHVDPTDHPGAVVGDRDFGEGVGVDRLAMAIRWLD